MTINTKQFSIQSAELYGFEALRSPIADSDVETVQLTPHPVRGSLLKARLGNFAFSTGQFSGSFRGSGQFSRTHFCMGLILDRAGEVVSFGESLEPGDILCTPPGGDHHIRFSTAASFAAIMIAPDDLRASVAGEPGLDDHAVWENALRCRTGARISEVTGRIRSISVLLETHGPSLSETAAEFWKRAILETFTSMVIHGGPLQRTHIPSSIKLVREIEDYVDARPDRPIHISEICATFHVSRRTLHRAFHDAVGIGPVAFLRRKRLCAVHTALINADPVRTRVTDVAIEFGFSELGRFAGYYLNMFGETPSATLQSARIIR